MILIKFSGFIVYSKPNNMTLSSFPGKIPETRIFFLIFNPSPNVAPKPTGRSRSHSIPRVPLQIYLAHFFVFDLSPKLRVAYIRKKFKIFIFSKMAPTIFIKVCAFIGHSNSNNMALSVFFRKNPRNFLIICPSPNVAPKPIDKSCSNSIFRALLQLSPARPFHFRRTLQIKGI